MWIVRLALRRPYTFVVVSILIVIMGGLAIVRTPTDIFPNIDIPVVSIIWNYNGLLPEDMSDRIVSVTERALTTTVDNIEHIESQSLYGIAVVKVFPAADREYSAGHCADHSNLSDPTQAVACGNNAASYSCLQRIECARTPIGPFRAKSIGATTQRLWSEFHSDAAHHGARRLRALSLWR